MAPGSGRTAGDRGRDVDGGEPGRGASRLPGQRPGRLTRVMIVEDERLMAELLTAVLENEEDLVVVGVAVSVGDVAAYRGPRPEVVLMDYRLPDGTGAEAARMIKTRWPGSRVLMLSALQDDETVLDSIKAGADGYLSKDRVARDIVASVRAVRAGETLLPPTLLSEIARRVAQGRSEALASHRLEPLTARERTILRELAEGHSSREICERLRVSPNTLRTHNQHIFAKLGAHSKLEAVTIALRLGIVPSPREAELAAEAGARPGGDPAAG